MDLIIDNIIIKKSCSEYWYLLSFIPFLPAPFIQTLMFSVYARAHTYFHYNMIHIAQNIFRMVSQIQILQWIQVYWFIWCIRNQYHCACNICKVYMLVKFHIYCSFLTNKHRHLRIHTYALRRILSRTHSKYIVQYAFSNKQTNKKIVTVNISKIRLNWRASKIWSVSKSKMLTCLTRSWCLSTTFALLSDVWGDHFVSSNWAFSLKKK